MECSKKKSADAASALHAKVDKYYLLKQQYTQLTAAFAKTNLQHANCAQEMKILSEKLKSTKQVS